MMFREFLVMRKAVIGFCIVAALLTALATSLSAVEGKYHADMVSTFVGAAWFTGCFASIFGVALGNGSREGARVFWTLPVPRWRSGLEIIAVDFAGIIVASLSFAAISTGISALLLIFMPHGNTFVWNFTWQSMVAALAMPLAVYTWSAVVGMLGRRVPYLGVVVMPVLMVWFGLSQIDGTIGNMFRAPIVTNPVFLYVFPMASHEKGFGPYTNFAWVTPEVALGMTIAITLAGCAAAIIMWSRSEVLA